MLTIKILLTDYVDERPIRSKQVAIRRDLVVLETSACGQLPGDRAKGPDQRCSSVQRQAGDLELVWSHRKEQFVHRQGDFNDFFKYAYYLRRSMCNVIRREGYLRLNGKRYTSSKLFNARQCFELFLFLNLFCTAHVKARLKWTTSVTSN